MGHPALLMTDVTAKWPLGVTGCPADGVPATDGLPSIAEGQMPRARHWQLNPNFRTNASGGPHGRIVPFSDFRGAIRTRDAADRAGAAQSDRGPRLLARERGWLRDVPRAVRTIGLPKP